MIKSLIISILFLSIFSCTSSNSEVYSKYKDLSEGGVWNENDAIFFKVNIDDTTSTYKMKFVVRFLEGFQYKNLNIKVAQTSPSQSDVSKEYSLKIVDENGDFYGEELAGVYDSESVVEEDQKFKEKGTYIFKIEPNMSVPEIRNALELGLVLIKNN